MESIADLNSNTPASIHQIRLDRIANGLAVAVAVSLPWSTSATGILGALWLVAVLLVLDFAAVRRETMTLAGGLPLLLWGLAVIGMLWADVGWPERIAALGGYHKLLVIPLLLAQFRRWEQGWWWAVLGFVASLLALLVVSWCLMLIPDIPCCGKGTGIPVKDNILQSGEFGLCAFGLLGWAVDLWRSRRRQFAAMLVFLAAIFVANIAYVALSRTTLVVIAMLFVLFALRHFSWKGTIGTCLVGGVLASLLWVSSPFLRARVMHAVEEVQTYRAADAVTSSGIRLEYWRRSIAFIARAPVIGNGTGMLPKLFDDSAVGETGAAARTTEDPHNQIIGVTIELGLLGAAALVSMWIAHLALFRGRGLIAWLGLIAVAQNMVSSIFNSHLFNFTQGWIYVFAVGVLGGTMLQKFPKRDESRDGVNGESGGVSRAAGPGADH